ncbi:hypothetical protein H6503_03255 [Candidatus Woesearchaeota archaeon]|nr:hypothetical protein [Candidatus Woesearchaeota archaeon]
MTDLSLKVQKLASELNSISPNATAETKQRRLTRNPYLEITVEGLAKDAYMITENSIKGLIFDQLGYEGKLNASYSPRHQRLVVTFEPVKEESVVYSSEYQHSPASSRPRFATSGCSRPPWKQ